MSLPSLSLVAFTSLTHLCWSCGRVCQVCNIGIDLSVTLSTLDIHTLLLGEFLVAGPLPFWQPSLGIWRRAWVFRIKVLWISCFMRSLSWNVNLSTTTELFQTNVFCLFILFPLRHTLLDKLLDQFIFILSFLIKFLLWQRLVEFFCFGKIYICQNSQVTSLN